MNAYGVILITASILTVLYWILNIADKCVKAGNKKTKEEAVALEQPEKEDEIEIPAKVLSFKRAMHDISNNV